MVSDVKLNLMKVQGPTAHTLINSQLDAACCSVLPASQANIDQAGVFPSIRLRGFREPQEAFFIQDRFFFTLHWQAVLHADTQSK